MALPTEAEACEAVATQVEDDAASDHVVAAAAEGLQMVTKHLGSAAEGVPDAVLMLAVTEAGAAVYYRRTARNGITTFGGAEVVPMRIAKDPMSTVYPILAPYASPGISR